MSAGALALLLLALVIIYDRARDDVTERVDGKSVSGDVERRAHACASHTRNVAGEARETVHSHPELVVFAIAAAVLVGFMLRT